MIRLKPPLNRYKLIFKKNFLNKNEFLEASYSYNSTKSATCLPTKLPMATPIPPIRTPQKT